MTSSCVCTSTNVSRSSSKKPLRLPFQKKVTCPNFCVSEHAKVFRPAPARYCPAHAEHLM